MTSGALNTYADPRLHTSEGPVDTFGCAWCVDAADNLIYNPGARELVQNNSQWHPGFPTLDSVPGTLPTGTVAPALLQTAVQAPLATIADQDLLAEDEAEVEDETYEDMDEIDDIGDDFDEDAVDDAEDTLLTTYAEAFANQPTLQPYAPDQHPYLPQVEYSMSDDQLSSEAENSDLPDLEEVLEPHETDQQTVDGSECLHHNAAQRANPLYSGQRRQYRGPVFSSPGRKKPMADHYSPQNPFPLRQTTLQRPPNRPKRHLSLPRHPLRYRPEINYHPSVTNPFITSLLPTSPEPEIGPRFRLPRPTRTPQHDGPDTRFGHRAHRQPSGARRRLDDDEVSSAVSIGI